MKQNEIIIIGIGTWISIMAFLRLNGGIKINSVTVLGFSLAALFFTIGDFIDTVRKEVDWKTNNKYLKPLFIFLNFLIEAPWTLGIGAIILLPHLPAFNELTEKQIAKVADFSTLLALGVVFILLGFKNMKSINNLKNQLKDMKELIVESRNLSSSIIQTTNKKTDAYEQKIQALDKNVELINQQLILNKTINAKLEELLKKGENKDK